MRKKDKNRQNGKSMETDNESTDVVEIESVGDELMSEESSAGKGPSELEAQLKAAKNDYLYLAAEFDNYKKQALKERSELLRYGGERLAREFLGVIDNFERALATENSPETFAAFRQGVELTSSELKNSLQKFGIQEVDCLGKPFDPEIHEAIGAEPTAEFEPGTVCRVFKKAFKMYDRLLRPAQVIVAKTPEEK